MKWLCADPGETTGWSLWEGKDLLEAGQAPMWEFVDQVTASALCIGGEWEHSNGPFVTDSLSGLGAIVCEDWQLFPWELQNLAWDKCRTARAIGALTLITRQAGIPFILQPAAIKNEAKAAGAESLYLTPLHENRHANDSIQHGVFYLAKNKGKAPC